MSPVSSLEELKDFCAGRLAEMETLSIVALEEGDDDTASYIEGCIDAYSIVFAKLGGELED